MRTGLWIPIVLGGVTILSYAGPLLNPEAFKFAIAILLMYPLMLVFNSFLFFLLVIRGRYLKALLPFLLILLGWPIHSKLIPFSASSVAPSTEDIKLVSFNANYGFSLGAQNEDAQKLPHLLKEWKHPDILCLQEHTADVHKWVESNFNFSTRVKKYEYRTVIYSRFPIVDQGALLFGNLENSCVWADFKLADGKVIRVYNIHLQSNRVTDQSKRLFEEGLEFSQSKLGELLEIVKNYRLASAKRVNQVKELLEHIKLSPYPVIIAGDLNDVPISYVYRKLSIGRKDSFLERGAGLGTTYAGPIPLLRIDLVMADPSFRVLSHEVLKGDFSDHYPLVVGIRTRNK